MFSVTGATKIVNIIQNAVYLAKMLANQTFNTATFSNCTAVIVGPTSCFYRISRTSQHYFREKFRTSCERNYSQMWILCSDLGKQFISVGRLWLSPGKNRRQERWNLLIYLSNKYIKVSVTQQAPDLLYFSAKIVFGHWPLNNKIKWVSKSGFSKMTKWHNQPPISFIFRPKLFFLR